MFKQEDIISILSDFPKFELSYEIMTHKKVYNSDIVIAIPEGKKYFAWFTSYKKDNVCFIMETTDDKRISNIQICLTSFNDSLALGTIFYGTIFDYQNKNKCFSIEDIYYYKGKSYSNSPFIEKMKLFERILTKDISQTALTNKYLIFGLPLMKQDFNLLLKETELLPYKVKQINFRCFNDKKVQFVKYFRPVANRDVNFNKVTNVIFKITPDIQNDIYNLFIYKNGKEEFYDIAFIPDYKTSVMMNRLFRNIKENENLDALEESDTEEEFESEREDKYVFLDRSFKMNCEFNSKFKKWYPVSIASKSDRIVSSNLISNRF